MYGSLAYGAAGTSLYLNWSNKQLSWESDTNSANQGIVPHLWNPKFRYCANFRLLICDAV
jgi:hypothetical protein